MLTPNSTFVTHFTIGSILLHGLHCTPIHCCHHVLPAQGYYYCYEQNYHSHFPDDDIEDWLHMYTLLVSGKVGLLILILVSYSFHLSPLLPEYATREIAPSGGGLLFFTFSQGALATPCLGGSWLWRRPDVMERAWGLGIK